MMPIGRFARACRLSVKALRHYDDEELLRPAHVDERTGYRYYTREQVRDAVTIGMLRGLGIGIPIIRRFLAGGAAERTAILRTEAERIEREMAQRRFALDAIARFGSTGTLAPYEVAIRRMEPVQVAERCVVTNAEALIVDTTALIYSLFDELRAAGRDVLSPVFCMNDDTGSEEHIVVHACVRVDPPAPDLRRARVVEVSGGEFAVVTHVGPYEQLGLAYHALYAWAQEHGHEPHGLIREIYVNDPANVPPGALQTDLLLPL
jgi:DNA-binding transcriptional MerR regulator/effector-binding domain-containing protein